jgi:uncharacterized protein with HEPN domain
MPLDERDAGYLWDILAAARLVRDFIGEMARDAFVADQRTYFAVISRLQVIGEATKLVSDAFKAEHAEVPWKQMAGMRDVLVHRYRQIDLDEVWRAASESVPALIEQLDGLLPDEPDDEDTPK